MCKLDRIWIFSTVIFPYMEHEREQINTDFHGCCICFSTKAIRNRHGVKRGDSLGRRYSSLKAKETHARNIRNTVRKGSAHLSLLLSIESLFVISLVVDEIPFLSKQMMSFQVRLVLLAAYSCTF
jgi:hypothetical protein